MSQTTLNKPALQYQTPSVGVDISKDKFDVCTYPGAVRHCFTNDTIGFQTFLEWLPEDDYKSIVFEPTGAYHRGFERYLGEAGLPLCKVNPYHARSFARYSGTRMKSDVVDAYMLGKMGSEGNLQPRPIISQDIDTMRELNVARTALMKEQTATTNRKATARHTIIKDQLVARLVQIKISLAEIDAAIDAIIDGDADLKLRKKILISIKGIGLISANVLIITMPELGTISNEQAASLLGVAPIQNQSGKHFGKEHIGGGRANVRRALYMPTLVAIQHNKDLKEKYRKLTEDRKLPLKVAIVAIMRKLIVLANTLLQKGQLWAEIKP